MKVLRIHPDDNVAVVLSPLQAGEVISAGGTDLTLAGDIPGGHKVCLRHINNGDNVVKYGFPIGHATADILPGQWVHTHNVATNLDGTLKYSYEPSGAPLPVAEPETFQGFRRRQGRPGIRNEVWIVPTVGCVNGVAEALARRANILVKGTVGGVYAFPHPYGCSQMGEDMEDTVKALCGLIRNPNAGAVLVLGLGCEFVQIPKLQEALGGYDPERVRFLSCQDHADELEAGMEALAELIGFAAQFRREPCPMSQLVVGLKCGGSDGYSGITANPVVGAFSDLLVAQGGSAILTEVPEMFGAETILMNRCPDRHTFEKTVSLINNYKDYFLRHGQVVYENPSPGNKDGGITTLEDKSLGCTQKGGTAPVADVLLYGKTLTTPGLNLLEAPGNDLVASSAIAASGAQLLLFTTGRGTPFGCPIPTVKISTNTPLAEKKSGWIDFNAGRLLSGRTMPQLSRELFDYVKALASGEITTKTEQRGIRELTIWRGGVTV